MFLREIPEAYKGDFLVAAQAFINADGKLETKEAEMMEQYFIEFHEEPKEIKGDFDEALKHMTGLDKTLRKKLFFEFAALCIVDKDYDAKEKDLLIKTGEALGIEKVEMSKIKDVAVDILKAYEQIEALFV